MKQWASSDEEVEEMAEEVEAKMQGEYRLLIQRAVPRKSWTVSDEKVAEIVAKVREELHQLIN